MKLIKTIKIIIHLKYENDHQTNLWSLEFMDLAGFRFE